MRRLVKAIRKNGPEILLAGLLSFFFLIYAPFENYAGNVLDLSYDVYDMAKILIPAAALSCAGVTAVLIVFRKLAGEKAESLLLLLGLSLFLAVYVQGAFLSGDLPVLDGSSIDWSAYPVQRWISRVLFAAAAATACILWRRLAAERIRRLARGASGLLLVFLLVTGILLGTGSHVMEDKLSIVTGCEGLMEMSSEENVIIFLPDSLEGSTLDDMFSYREDYEEIFEDFTFFRDTVGTYPFTTQAVPFILTGEYYRNDGDFTAYESRAYASSPLFSALEAEGYDLLVYDDETTPASADSVQRFRNVSSVEKTEFLWPSKFLKMQLKFVALRYLPYDLKPLFVMTPQDIAYDSEIVTDISGFDVYSGDNDAFWQRLEDTPVTLTEGKTFHFIHIQGPHAPFDYGEGMVPAEDGDYRDGVRATVTILQRYLEALKEAGVYDNSTIVILGDHGYYHRQNPALLIKTKEESHPLAISDAKVSYDELQDIFSGLLAGKSAEDAVESAIVPDEPRLFLWYDLGEDEVMEEMVQTGFAPDDSTLVPTGNVYTRSGS